MTYFKFFHATILLLILSQVLSRGRSSQTSSFERTRLEYMYPGCVQLGLEDRLCPERFVCLLAPVYIE